VRRSSLDAVKETRHPSPRASKRRINKSPL
jgi:hypothetical protein